MASSRTWHGQVGLAAVIAVSALAGTLMVGFLIMGLIQREPPTYSVTAAEPRPANGRLVGPDSVTVDATHPEQWRYFSFAAGTTVDRPGPLEWDIAFRRFQVMVNGGQGFAGSAGVVDLGEQPFESVRAVPTRGYVVNTVRSDTLNAEIGDWYSYSYFTHLLTPRARTFAVRTADGRFAKLQFVGYYCPGATPGCVTFRYVFQGAGGPDLST
ncbi:MAG: HmuY family protein [Gemmatimonadota bacterium]